MCIDPVTATLVSAGVSAVGSMATGLMHASTANANAAALESSARQRQEKAKFDIERADVAYRRQTGTIMAKIGTTGIDMTSFDSVLADDAKEIALQKKAIQVGADIDSANLRFQAAGQKAQATSDIIGGIFGAAGAVAKGYGQSQLIEAIRAKSDKLGGVAIDSGGW